MELQDKLFVAAFRNRVCLFRFRQNKFWLLPVSSPLLRLFATRSRVAGDHASQTHPITPFKLLLRYFLTDSPSVSTTIWCIRSQCRLVSSVLNPKIYYCYSRFFQSYRYKKQYLLLQNLFMALYKDVGKWHNGVKKDITVL